MSLWRCFCECARGTGRAPALCRHSGPDDASDGCCCGGWDASQVSLALQSSMYELATLDKPLSSGLSSLYCKAVLFLYKVVMRLKWTRRSENIYKIMKSNMQG